MLTVNNLSVQFGKRILFDEATSHTVIWRYGANGAGKSTFQNNSEMDPTSGHIHLEVGKRMFLNQTNI
jgi:ATPase subunit of ABC transporter with duplicated ATPase domains